MAATFSMALGTKLLTSTNSGSLAPSGLRSEQWSLSPQGPRPSSVGTASQMSVAVAQAAALLAVDRHAEFVAGLLPELVEPSVAGLRGQGRDSVRISTFTSQA